MAVDIALTSKHFLYLPLYYAHSKDWFGYLDNLQQPKPSIAPIGEFAQVSDREVIQRVNSPAQAWSDVVLGLCDPSFLSNMDFADRQNIRVLAATVTNSGLWAVGSVESEQKINSWSIDELSTFETCYAYEGENTSREVARAISGVRKINNIPIIGTEAQFLATEVNNLRKSKGVVVVTPNILHVMHAQQMNPSVQPLFPIGATERYIGTLSCALIVKYQFLLDNPEYCEHVCQALQRSMINTICKTNDVVDVAWREFGQGEIKISRDTVNEALRQAISARVFPPVLSINKGEWNAGCRAHLRLHGQIQDGDEIMRRAYNHHIKNQEDNVQNITANELGRFFTPDAADTYRFASSVKIRVSNKWTSVKSWVNDNINVILGIGTIITVILGIIGMIVKSYSSS